MSFTSFAEELAVYVLVKKEAEGNKNYQLRKMIFSGRDGAHNLLA